MQLGWIPQSVPKNSDGNNVQWPRQLLWLTQTFHLEIPDGQEIWRGWCGQSLNVCFTLCREVCIWEGALGSPRYIFMTMLRTDRSEISYTPAQEPGRAISYLWRASKGKRTKGTRHFPVVLYLEAVIFLLQFLHSTFKLELCQTRWCWMLNSLFHQLLAQGTCRVAAPALQCLIMGGVLFHTQIFHRKSATPILQIFWLAAWVAGRFYTDSLWQRSPVPWLMWTELWLIQKSFTLPNGFLCSKKLQTTCSRTSEHCKHWLGRFSTAFWSVSVNSSEQLVLRARLGFALAFLCIYSNTKPLQLPPDPRLGPSNLSLSSLKKCPRGLKLSQCGANQQARISGIKSTGIELPFTCQWGQTETHCSGLLGLTSTPALNGEQLLSPLMQDWE